MKKHECDCAGAYLIGIHRSGEDTLPNPQVKNNGVKGELTSRYMKSFDIMKGYLIAIISELQFEGTNHIKFKVRTMNWDEDAENLFKDYLEIVPEWVGNIMPLGDRPGK